ncbi:MAG: protein-L-isoaspartate(D-aspartate) O-methyltransferase [Maricaulaceae bacterium]
MFDPGLIDMIMALRGRGISDNPVLRAMELSPRKNFVDLAYFDVAYAEQALPIACGQTLTSPFNIALMTQMLEVSQDHKVLEIGTGSGYHAAILSHLCRRVYTVERYNALLEGAEAQFKKLGIVNIVSNHGDGRYGWPGQSPFDRILVTCGLKSPPRRLLKQLSPDGMMIAVINGQLTKLNKNGAIVTQAALMPMELPIVEAGKSKIL